MVERPEGIEINDKMVNFQSKINSYKGSKIITIHNNKKNL